MKQFYPVSDCHGITKVCKEWEEKLLLVVVSVNLIQDSIRSPKVIRSKEACCRLPRGTESFAKADVSFTILIVDCTIWNVSYTIWIVDFPASASLQRTANSSQQCLAVVWDQLEVCRKAKPKLAPKSSISLVILMIEDGHWWRWNWWLKSRMCQSWAGWENVVMRASRRQAVSASLSSPPPAPPALGMGSAPGAMAMASGHPTWQWWWSLSSTSS